MIFPQIPQDETKNTFEEGKLGKCVGGHALPSRPSMTMGCTNKGDAQGKRRRGGGVRVRWVQDK